MFQSFKPFNGYPILQAVQLVQTVQCLVAVQKFQRSRFKVRLTQRRNFYVSGILEAKLLIFLAEAKKRHRVKLLGFCLIPNHFHLVLEPAHRTALSQFRDHARGYEHLMRPSQEKMFTSFRRSS